MPKSLTVSKSLTVPKSFSLQKSLILRWTLSSGVSFYIAVLYPTYWWSHSAEKSHTVGKHYVNTLIRVITEERRKMFHPKTPVWAPFGSRTAIAYPIICGSPNFSSDRLTPSLLSLHYVKNLHEQFNFLREHPRSALVPLHKAFSFLFYNFWSHQC